MRLDTREGLVTDIAMPVSAGKHIHYWKPTILSFAGLVACVECRQYGWRLPDGKTHIAQACEHQGCHEPALCYRKVRDKPVFRCTQHVQEWPS